jgi:branched-chain amino acid transport system ATP-binding protein
MTLLETRGLTVTYGGVQANSDVDISVKAGQVCGLIGPNGAGKTTFIDAIAGFTRPTSGEVLLDGRSIDSLSPVKRANAGLTRTFQSGELFDDLSVWENLLVAAERPLWWSSVADLLRPRRRSSAADQAQWALDLTGLDEFRDRLTVHLSQGQRKLVSVARAIASRPKLVLLDEPAAGLDTRESQIIGTHLRDFLEREISVFLIDHDMALVLSVCDYIYVLDFGRIIAEGTPAEIRTNPAVVAAYLGEPEGVVEG